MEIPETRRFIPKGFELGTTAFLPPSGKFYIRWPAGTRSIYFALEILSDEWNELEWEMFPLLFARDKSLFAALMQFTVERLN